MAPACPAYAKIDRRQSKPPTDWREYSTACFMPNGVIALSIYKRGDFCFETTQSLYVVDSSRWGLLPERRAILPVRPYAATRAPSSQFAFRGVM
jgi:hypothetical protein